MSGFKDKLRNAIFTNVGMFQGKQKSFRNLAIGILLITSSLAVMREVIYPSLNDEKNPVRSFSKYDMLKTNTTKAIEILENKETKHLTLVIVNKGCTDCEKYEGEITYQLNKAKKMKNNNTKYVLVDLANNTSKAKELSKQLPGTLTSPLRTPTVANLELQGSRWQLKQAFIESGTTKAIDSVFSDSVS